MEALEIGLKLALDEYIKRIGFDPSGLSRKHEFVSARNGFMAAAKINTEATLNMVGRIFYRDHATVLHALKVVNNASALNDEKSEAMISNYLIAKKAIIKHKNSTPKKVADSVDVMRLKSKIKVIEQILNEKNDKIDSLKVNIITKNGVIKVRDKEIERLKKELNETRSSNEDFEYTRLRKMASRASLKKLSDKFNGY